MMQRLALRIPEEAPTRAIRSEKRVCVMLLRAADQCLRIDLGGESRHRHEPATRAVEEQKWRFQHPPQLGYETGLLPDFPGRRREDRFPAPDGPRDRLPYAWQGPAPGSPESEDLDPATDSPEDVSFDMTDG